MNKVSPTQNTPALQANNRDKANHSWNIAKSQTLGKSLWDLTDSKIQEAIHILFVLQQRHFQRSGEEGKSTKCIFKSSCSKQGT